MSVEEQIDEILSDFLENTAEAIDETDFHRRNTAIDEAIKEAANQIKAMLSNISIQSRIDTYLDCANEGSGSPILRAYARRRAEQLKEQLKESK